MNVISLIKNAISDQVLRQNVFKRPSVKYCIENDLLPSVLVRTPSETLRKILNLPVSEYETQLNQDIFALLMNQFRPGFFVEIGANDGFRLSNTLYLETNFGWKGVLVEPNPKYLMSLEKRKNSVVVNKAISSHDGEADFIDAGLYGGLREGLDNTHDIFTKGAGCISVDCIGLREILDSATAPEQIDFISVDVEGGEVPIVEQMVSVDRRFKCGCIEHNNRTGDYKRIAGLLNAAGYTVVWKDQTQQDLFFVDNRNVHNLPVQGGAQYA